MSTDTCATIPAVEASKDSNKEALLRAQILDLVRQYYEVAHHPAQNAPFRPGESFVNYAGRVFDHTDMEHLVDASLDFFLTQGRFAKKFEQDLAKAVGVRSSLIVNSGSSANLLAFSTLTSPDLKERRIQRGDEIITVACGFPTTVAPAIQFGAVPVFLDVCLEDGTYNVDVSLLEAAVSPRTKAVMIAHTLGNPFNLAAVTEFCAKHNLWLIEDNCDALGSEYDGKHTGTFGDLATLSFYPAHHLTMGEGGAVLIKTAALKRIAESFRDWGRDCWCEAGKDNTCGKRFGWKLGELPEGYDHKYIYRHFGYNLKVTDMQAALGCSQLPKLPGFVSKRRENWLAFRSAFADLEDRFILPNPTPRSNPSWFGFLLTVREGAGFTRDDFTQFFEGRKIQTRALFAGNLLKHPLFDEMRTSGEGYRVVGSLQNSDTILKNTLWFGVYPGLSSEKRDYIIDSVRSFCQNSSR